MMPSYRINPQPLSLFNTNQFTDDVCCNDYFALYIYKVVDCGINEPHNWRVCDFKHNGERARRRDPHIYDYSPYKCPAFERDRNCLEGDSCRFSHGTFECGLHPARYKTSLCAFGQYCTRFMCFFAHNQLELRELSASCPTCTLPHITECWRLNYEEIQNYVPDQSAPNVEWIEEMLDS